LSLRQTDFFEVLVASLGILLGFIKNVVKQRQYEVDFATIVLLSN